MGATLTRTSPTAPSAVIHSKMIPAEIEEAQKCFVDDEGFMVCNFVIRKGKKVRSHSGKNLRFKARNRLRPRRKQKSPEIVISSEF